MKVLLVSKFLHHVGGVETYLRWQANALHEAGHQVALLGMEPPPGVPLMELPDVPMWRTPHRDYRAGLRERAAGASASVWSPATAAVMRKAVSSFAPDVVHFHGTCYQLTPSVVDVAASAGLRSVITAHEYKLTCANQTLFDDGSREICTDCVGRSGPGKSLAVLRRSCMKGSTAVSAIGALEGRVADRVWRRARPRVLAPSNFMRDMLVSDGWGSDRVEYLDLPWRSDDEFIAHPDPTTARNVVFLGRLAANKGVDVLLEAWRRVAPDLASARLRILGEGAEEESLREQVRRDAIPRVDFLGYGDRARVSVELSRAFASAHPSRWHENSPFSVRESLMAGVPALVSQLGGMPEMVGAASGYVIPHDDVSEWSRTLKRAERERKVGSSPLREEVEARAMTRGRHLELLMDAYRRG